MNVSFPNEAFCSGAAFSNVILSLRDGATHIVLSVVSSLPRLLIDGLVRSRRGAVQMPLSGEKAVARVDVRSLTTVGKVANSPSLHS